MTDWAHSLSPSDATVALRSFRRRWEGLLAQAGEEEDPDGVLRRRPPDGSPSVHELLTDTAAVLAPAAGRLRAVRLGTGPEDGTVVPAPSGGSDVDHLAAAAEALAAEIAEVPSDGWRPPGGQGSGTGALDVVRDAVSAAADNLRQAERTLAQVRGRPG